MKKNQKSSLGYFASMVEQIKCFGKGARYESICQSFIKIIVTDNI